MPIKTTTSTLERLCSPDDPVEPDHCIVTELKEGWKLIRKIHSGERLLPLGEDAPLDIPELKCAVIGNVDAGKSTLLGVLSRGHLDDGRGYSRQLLFRHPHESQTGRTSSVNQEILAFGADCRALIPASSNSSQGAAWAEVLPKAVKIISFFDLAGHERYLKTTMFGLASTFPALALLVIGANDGGGMTKEHLLLAWALGIPVVVVLTKIDLAPASVREDTVNHISKMVKKLSNGHKSTLLVKSATEAYATSTLLSSICPIIPCSSVTGAGLDLLHDLLGVIPTPGTSSDDEVEYHITETYTVQGVGTVVSGSLNRGSIRAGQTLHIGPDFNGQFTPVTVKSIHLKRQNVASASAPHTIALALKKTKRSQIRKGAVILSNPRPPAWEFIADIVILFQHSTTIVTKYQAVVHCGVVRQTAQILEIIGSEGNDGVLRSGNRARARFRFLKYPEYLEIGAKLLFREGRTKGVGRITELFQ